LRRVLNKKSFYFCDPPLGVTKGFRTLKVTRIGTDRNTTYQIEGVQDMALYFFDTKVIDKPNIHEYARWCMKRVTDSNVVYMFQWKLTNTRQM
jgi:hypothetical protein